MVEDDRARRIEELIDGDAPAPAGDPELVADLARQRRVHLLLTAQLTESEPDRIFAAIRSNRSVSRRERIAQAIGQQAGRPMRRRRPRRHQGLYIGWMAAAALVLLAVGLWRMMPTVKAAPTPAPSPAAGPLFAIQLTKAPPGLVVQRVGKELAATVGMELLPGDGLAATTDGAELSYADGSQVRLAAGTRLDLQPAAPGKRLRLGAGVLTASVAHQPEGAPLVVTGTRGQAEVVGTVFTFAEDVLGSRLQVDDGQVRLSGTGSTLLVAAGTQAIAARERGPEPYTPFATSGLTTRLTDECDDLEIWNIKLGGLMERTTVRDAPASGPSCMRLEFRFVADKSNWSSRGRALTLKPTDRAIRFRLRVERAESGAEFFLRVSESDKEVWVLAQWPVAAGSGWRTVVVPIPPAERPPRATGSPEGHWQAKRVQQLHFGGEAASLTVCVDQIEVLTGP